MDTFARYLAAVATIGFVVFAIWQLDQESSILPDAATGLILLGVGVVAGLRIGYRSARTFIHDAVRTNRVVLELNCELTQLNRWLMKQILTQKATSDGSTTLAEQERKARG